MHTENILTTVFFFKVVNVAAHANVTVVCLFYTNLLLQMKHEKRISSSAPDDVLQETPTHVVVAESTVA